MSSQRNYYRLRQITALSIAFFVLLYVIGVIGGYIPVNQRFSITDLVVIAVAALGITLLLRPDSMSRLKLLEMGGFKLELLERVKEQQERQENRLEVINLMLPLLLPKPERKHLLNLEEKRTHGYEGNGSLRAELRRLRSIGLIQMKSPNIHVAEMTDGKKFNLANYIDLTPLGNHWVQQIKEIEKEQTAPTKTDGSADR